MEIKAHFNAALSTQEYARMTGVMIEDITHGLERVLSHLKEPKPGIFIEKHGVELTLEITMNLLEKRNVLTMHVNLTKDFEDLCRFMNALGQTTYNWIIESDDGTRKRKTKNQRDGSAESVKV